MTPGFYPGIFVWGGWQTDKNFLQGGQLFVYWGPIISSVYSIYATDRKGKRNFLCFYQFPSEIFQFLSICMRNLWIIIKFHAKFFNFYQFACENFEFYQFSCEIFEYLSISKRKFSVFANYHAKFLNIYLFPCEIFQFLSILMRNFE